MSIKFGFQTSGTIPTKHALIRVQDNEFSV